MYDFSKFQRTYNKAIDECASIIGLARDRNVPIKALHLRPVYYEWYKSGVQTLMDRPLVEDEKMQFDGVDIEKGSKLQTRNIVIEYYEPVGQV